MITVEKHADSEGISYETFLTTVGGTSISVLIQNYGSGILVQNSEIGADFAIRLCKITGANGYYIDDKKNLTLLHKTT